VSLHELTPAYRRVIHALTRQPGLSREEIADQAFVGATTLSGGGYLKEMKKLGLIHISGWRRNGAGSFCIPLYSVGHCEDYVRPSVTAKNRAAPGMARLLEAIERQGPLDYRQAAGQAGLSTHTVKNAGYLDALVAQGKIYVVEWRRSRRGPFRPVYEAGQGIAAAPPVPLSSAQKSRAHRQRRRAVAAADNFASQLRHFHGDHDRI
jgi:hypothetical protein